ncbi:MAG: 2Fe-2S iron-sulfur cluster-binding protein [Rhodospirillaceae bacterium]
MTDDHSETAPEIMKVSVWRGGPGGGGFSDYDVPRQPSQTILDVVTWIQRNAEPKLTYRFACRVGMCGSCAMMVNGRPRWTCRTHVRKVLDQGRIEIAPLRNLPVIKDLAADMTEFFRKWTRAEGHFHPTKTRDDGIVPVKPDDPRRLAASAGIECINCAVCYAACDVVEGNKDYLGPAALNRAWTLINDERDGGRLARLKAVSQSGGCHSCHSQAGCAEHCPNELNPTLSIAGLKQATFKAALKGEI